MKIKAIDIAKRLNVSKATVSLALNGKPGISDEMRERVFACRSQMEKEMQKGGVLWSCTFSADNREAEGHPAQDLRNPFYQKMKRGMQEAAAAGGYEIREAYCQTNRQSLSDLVERANREADGLLLHASNQTAFAESRDAVSLYRQITIPYVLYDMDIPTLPCDQVRAGNRQAVEMAWNYLKKKGYSSVVYLSTRELFFYNYQKRKETARAIMEREGRRGGLEIIEVDRAAVDEKGILTPDGLGKNRDDVVAYIRRTERLPQAFIGDDFITTVALIEALEKYGYRIPGDCAVIGLDPPVLKNLKYNLTCIDFRDNARGNAAVRRLIDRIEGRAGEYFLSLEICPGWIPGNTVRARV